MRWVDGREAATHGSKLPRAADFPCIPPKQKPLAELSAAVCAEAQPGHAKAVQGVADALASLRAALAAEAAVRAGIDAAGYQCSLEAVAEPELNFADTESAASRLMRDVTRRLEVERLRAGGPVNIRLLVDGTGFGDLGDVVKIDGPDAAHVVALGHGEPTTAKPGKLPRLRESIALVLG